MPKGHDMGLYYLTIVDLFTGMVWVHILKRKSEAAAKIRDVWLPKVERQQERLVKMLISDRGGEFLSEELTGWLNKQGISHRLTQPYSPSMNGAAERANRTITEVARCMLNHSGVPDKFWPEAVRHAAFVKNRILTTRGEQQWVPMQRWLGYKPKVDMLRVWGCMALALIPKQFRGSKLEPVARWAVHLGMDPDSKGWQLWDPVNRKLLVSRDVKFLEEVTYNAWQQQQKVHLDLKLQSDASHEWVELPDDSSYSGVTWEEPMGQNPSEDDEVVEQQILREEPKEKEKPQIEAEGGDRVGARTPQLPPRTRPKRTVQPRKPLTYSKLGEPSAKGAFLMGAEEPPNDEEDEETEEVVCAFAFGLPGEPNTFEEALETPEAEQWKQAL